MSLQVDTKDRKYFGDLHSLTSGGSRAEETRPGGRGTGCCSDAT